MFLKGFTTIPAIVLLVNDFCTLTSQDKATDSSYLGKAWYVKEGSSIAIPCLTGENEKTGYVKYKGGIFDWTYRMKADPVLDYKKILYGNGTMLIRNISRFDSGTYICSAEKIDGSFKEEFFHSIMVHNNAQFFLVYPFLYTIPFCDIRASEKQNDIMDRLCSSWNTGETCPFSARMECYTNIGEKGEYIRHLRIHVEQKLGQNFEIPECDAKCIKKAVFDHFKEMGDQKVKDVVESESKGSSDPKFKDFSFDGEEFLHKTLSVRCPNGHQIYMQVLCVPCFPGTYAFQDDRFSYKSAPNECEPCDIGFYQELFAMDICYKCPKFGITTKRGSLSRKDCIDGHATQSEIYIAAGAILLFGFSLSSFCLTRLGISILKEKNREKLRSVGLEVKPGLLTPGFSSSTSGRLSSYLQRNPSITNHPFGYYNFEQFPHVGEVRQDQNNSGGCADFNEVIKSSSSCDMED